MKQRKTRDKTKIRLGKYKLLMLVKRHEFPYLSKLKKKSAINNH